jgi:hypothetical protein
LGHVDNIDTVYSINAQCVEFGRDAHSAQSGPSATRLRRCGNAPNGIALDESVYRAGSKPTAFETSGGLHLNDISLGQKFLVDEGFEVGCGRSGGCIRSGSLDRTSARQRSGAESPPVAEIDNDVSSPTPDRFLDFDDGLFPRVSRR